MPISSCYKYYKEYIINFENAYPQILEDVLNDVDEEIDMQFENILEAMLQF